MLYTPMCATNKFKLELVDQPTVVRNSKIELPFHAGRDDFG